jgi:hypothetical protein
MSKVQPSAFSFSLLPPLKQRLQQAYHAIEYPPSSQPWDEFLDFSKIKMPLDIWTVSCRLEVNLFHHFKGNYFVIWSLGMMIFGFVLDYFLLLSLLLMTVTWAIICICSINPSHWHQQNERGTIKRHICDTRYVGIEDERVSN